MLAAMTLIVGCATQPRGPAYRHEREFRQQVAESLPVKDWGYTIQEVKFSADYHKVLVVFAVPGKTNLTEVVLEDDGFGRYDGSVRDDYRFQKAITAKPLNIDAVTSSGASLRITFPNK